MTQQHQEQLDWVQNQQDRMSGLVDRWARINTGSHNVEGLQRFEGELTEPLAALGADIEVLDLEPAESIDDQGHVELKPIGRAIRARKRSDAPLQIFLGIHMDTVYAVDHPFQETCRLNDNKLRGPGVADAKGGLVVMLTALEALERSGLGNTVGWEVLINPDEEIGSMSSLRLLQEAASRNDLGLVFEPTLPDGTLVGARGGSGNYTAVVRGRSAHAGREFHVGRNAIDAAAALITSLSAINESQEGITLNVGKINGGGPVNVVPDLAICRFNIRMSEPQMQRIAEEHIAEAIAEISRLDGITVDLHGRLTSPVKPLDEATNCLFEHVADCGNVLGVPISWQPSGGVCDGNKLAAAGLPTIDTLGPRGGAIHSPEEYILLDSMAERAKLSALLLMKLAIGELPWPPSQNTNRQGVPAIDVSHR